MKDIFKLMPQWLKVLLYFLVLWSATLMAGAVPFLNDLTFFFAIALITSWIFLKSEGATLRTLRCLPTSKKDISQFLTGLGIGALMLVCAAVITLSLTGDKWTFNRHIDPIFIAVAFITCLWSVYVQEFAFRGYPFQALLQQYRPWLAQLIIAIPFGLMHIHQNMSNSEIMITMLSTGGGSLLFGLAFLKTNNLMLPVGIHLGWNYLQTLIPRIADGKNSGLIIIKNTEINYSSADVIAPYFIVLAVSFVLIFFWYPTQRIESKNN